MRAWWPPVCLGPWTGIGHRAGCSPPWGNWGVDSNHGSRLDSFQWAGWKHIPGDPWLQWSACTKGRFKPPNPEYYNDNNNTTQKASPDNRRWYATHNWTGGPGRTCDQTYGNTYVYRSNYMDLYELDAGGFPVGGDDYVTTLSFGNISVPIDCPTDWRCSGKSGWKSSYSDDNGSARIRISISTRKK